MTRPANVQAFIDRHSRQWADMKMQTGIPISVLVAQTALETGWGSSKVYREGANLFGFRYYPRHDFYVVAPNGQNYAGYHSHDASAADYIWLMTRAESPNFQPSFREWAGYTAVIDAAKTMWPGTTEKEAALRRAREVCAALGRSKFCEGGGYNNSLYGDGGVLYGILLANDLIELDRPWPHLPPQVGDPSVPWVPYDPDAPGPDLVDWLKEKGLDTRENVRRFFVVVETVVEVVKETVGRIGKGLEGLAYVATGVFVVFVMLYGLSLVAKIKGKGDE